MALLPAMNLAERMRKEIKASQIEGHDIRLTSSFGVSQVRAGETPHEAIVRADRTMYEAKHRGRDQVSAAPDRRPA